MGEEIDVAMKGVRKQVMEKILANGKRMDGREMGSFREIKIQKGAISTAEGSAMAQIGETKVLAAVKFDVMTPFPDRPTEGVFITNAEHLPLASPLFEPGPPREDSIEMARTVDRAIRSAEIIDLNSFFIEEDKVLGLFVDLYVLNHAGNYTDASTLAATAALMDTKMPKIENAGIVRGEYNGKLPLKDLPVSVTFGQIGKNWLIDPILDEEKVLDTRITIATTENHVCAIQKAEGWLTKEELLDHIDIAFKNGSELRKILRS